MALGHRRLAILDLTEAGLQPMTSPSGRYVMSYNGEIYNFLELRRLLEGRGVRFRTESDAEVILAAFEHWGPDCLMRFNGMWSIAIWDRWQRRLFLLRDRFGVKPLYVSISPRRLAFASELKAFLRLDGFDPAENTDAISARLAGDAAARPASRRRVAAPGYWLKASHEGVRRWRWWNTLTTRQSATRSRRPGEQFRELLFEACTLRLRSDVPIASALSGGLDSSSVVCSLARAQGRRGAERRRHHWRRATSRDSRHPPGRIVAATRDRRASRRHARSSTGSRGTRSARTSTDTSISTRRSAACTESRAGSCTARCDATASSDLAGWPWWRRAARRLRPAGAAGTRSRPTLHHAPRRAMDPRSARCSRCISLATRIGPRSERSRSRRSPGRSCGGRAAVLASQRSLVEGLRRHSQSRRRRREAIERLGP